MTYDLQVRVFCFDSVTHSTGYAVSAEDESLGQLAEELSWVFQKLSSNEKQTENWE